ncbi:dnaJ (Hsp40) homolog, subfamily C, member 30b [Eucyclogobius newberryi]|uniref:dnaJ (Hsp40) homolog, subfamily C, member 30b n=1 Tax=Eucyclogobius newberryi TaxID=166745 RepID=UPI003B5A7227
MTPWARGVVCACPDTFRYTQQVKAFCTFAFLLPEQKFKTPPRVLLFTKLQSCSGTRHYNWRGRDSHNRDAAFPQNTRTAYYDVLKVTPHATQSQIKTAYYKQSFIYHPDKNPGNVEATQIFSQISEAYSVLGNLTLRRKYDRGILSDSDLRSPGKPSKDSPSSRQTGPTSHQRARQFTQRRGKVFFDFDAFYKAHYGEQLQREQEMRARKQRMEEMQEKNKKAWQEQKIFEILVTALFASAGLIIYNIKNS